MAAGLEADGVLLLFCVCLSPANVFNIISVSCALWALSGRARRKAFWLDLRQGWCVGDITEVVVVMVSST